MALTLVEAAKLHSGTVVRSSIIELFARSSDILRVLPFEDIAGNAYSYNQEQTLPGVGFRGVNEGYKESTGILNPLTETLVIAGGDLDVDRFIIQTQGADQRSVQEAMKIKALALTWSQKFIKGDATFDSKEFNGIQNRCVGKQLTDCGLTSGGDALSLGKLDELIDSVLDPGYLYMNKQMRRRLTAAARDMNVGGFINTTKDAFGRPVTTYNDLPILVADEDAFGNMIMPFDEPAASGPSETTSIYCMSFGEGKFSGIQNGLMDVKDLGELESKPVYRTRIEWYNGLVIFNGKSCARLRYIKDSPVTK